MLNPPSTITYKRFQPLGLTHYFCPVKSLVMVLSFKYSHLLSLLVAGTFPRLKSLFTYPPFCSQLLLPALQVRQNTTVVITFLSPSHTCSQIFQSTVDAVIAFVPGNINIKQQINSQNSTSTDKARHKIKVKGSFSLKQVTFYQPQ